MGDKMRDIETIMIEKAIIYVLDRNTDMPLLTDYEQEISEC